MGSRAIDPFRNLSVGPPRSVASVLVSALALSACGGTESADPADPSVPSTASSTTVSDADDLADGERQVRVGSADLVEGSVTLDGVQVLSGMDAVLAYLADTDGQQLEGAQVYVRNGIQTPQDFPVDAAGVFSVILADSCCDPVEVGWSGLATSAANDFADLWGGSPPPFTAVIEDGMVVSLEQIYIP